MKYLILSFLFMTSIGWLKAQEQDTIQQGIENPIPVNETPNINKQTGEIIITGPNGQVIDEDTTEEVILEEEDELVNEEKEPENNGVPRIIYYQSAESGTDDRRYKSEQRKSDIKTLSGSMNHSGGFGAVSFRYSDFNDESLVMAGMRGGWIVNRTLGIGFEGHGVIPTSRYEEIEDNRDVVLVGGYGGMFLELIFFSNQVLHVTFPVSAGAGWLGYTEHWENDFTNPPYQPGDSLYLTRRNQLVDDDTFWYVEPGANIELNVSRNFRMCFGVSKRFTQDFTLKSTPVEAFNKPNYYVTLKFGRF